MTMLGRGAAVGCRPVASDAPSRVPPAMMKAMRGMNGQDDAIVSGISGAPMNRRELLQSAGAVLITPAAAALSATGQQADPPPEDRSLWISVIRRLAEPVLNNLATGTPRRRRPAAQPPSPDSSP